MKHTPGPWTYRSSSVRSPYWSIVAPDKLQVAKVTPRIHGNGNADGQANAILIAAAPDLLAACKLAIDEWSSDPLDPLGRRAAAERFIRMAIDKGAA